jgi:subtilisin-like proprotein convertase family protein
LIAAACPSVAAQGLQKFGPPKGKPALRTFGNPVGEDTLRRQFPRLAAAVSSADRQEATREIQRTDLDGDGIVTPAEWNAAGYQAPDRFRTKDLNRDGFFTFFELCLSWAQSRTGGEQTLKAAEAALSQTASRPSSQSSPSTVWRPGTSSYRDRRLARSRRIQIDELTAQTMAFYDRNRNKRIEKNEFHGSPLGGDLTKADADNDGAIASSEISTWLTEILDAQPSPQPPDNAPPWFHAADFDADGQVQLSEYRRISPQAAFTDFERYDRNADGFVTALEASSSLAADVLRFPSTRPAVVEAETQTQLELLITDDLPIRDIDLQIALVKNGDEDLELSLLAPDGTRAELYFDAKTKPWGGSRIFYDTLIDDEAPIIAPPPGQNSAQPLARPPLNRSFRSQGSTAKGKQGLKSLYGKNARGTWQLHIHNPSQIAGLLEGWALLIRPARPASPPTASSPPASTPPPSPTPPPRGP